MAPRTGHRKKKLPQGPPPELGEGSKICSLPGYVKKALEKVEPDNEKCTNIRANYASCSIRVIPEHVYKNEELISLLTELIAKHNVIKKMQPYINLCHQLTLVDLSYNLITAMPKEILMLEQLNTLNFAGNRLKKIPGLQKLPKLKAANFSHNKIKKLKGSLFTSKSIQVFDLSHNVLKSLPKQIYKEPVTLDFSHNNISSLPRVPDRGGHHLNGLNVSYNKLKELPLRFGSLACLATLNISHNNFTHIEEEVTYTVVKDGDLIYKTMLVHFPYYLTSIDISYNNISALGLMFIKLRGVRHLNASNNQISMIPEKFVKLDCLIQLDLSHNNIEDIANRFNSMRNLKHIKLNNNEINTFGNLWHLNNIETLHISHNNITVLPDEIEEMYELKELHACSNRIQEIPDSIGRLTCLKTLDLAHNKISEIPHSLGIAQLLQVLNLSHNTILFLPNDLHKWRALESLNLQQNGLTFIQKTFHSIMNNLTELDISKNNISEIIIPSSVQQLALAENPFSNMDKVLTGRLLLDKLNLSNLHLQDLPTHVAHYRVLTELDVSQNSLVSLSGETLSCLKNLQWLDCSRNELLGLPDEITLLTNLHYLDCSYNQINTLNDNLLLCPLQTLQVQYNRLTKLDIHHVQKNSLTPQPLAFKLKYLDISHNQISEFLRYDLHLYASIETVLASHNNITWIHPHITYLYRLKEMDFSHNDIIFLPKTFEKMACLKTLLLQDNLLDAISDNICKMTNLQHLDVSHNRIFTWPAKWPKYLTICPNVVYDKQRSRKREPKVPPQNSDEVSLIMSGKEVHSGIKKVSKHEQQEQLAAAITNVFTGGIQGKSLQKQAPHSKKTKVTAAP